MGGLRTMWKWTWMEFNSISFGVCATRFLTPCPLSANPPPGDTVIITEEKPSPSSPNPRPPFRRWVLLPPPAKLENRIGNKRKRKKTEREKMEGTISYMIDNLMCHPPIILQNVVILRSRREGQFLRYWLITNHHQFKARLLACFSHFWRSHHRGRFSWVRASGTTPSSTPLPNSFTREQKTMKFKTLQSRSTFTPFTHGKVERKEGRKEKHQETGREKKKGKKK